MKSFKTFKPRKEFVEKTKNVYLAAFREKFGDAHKPHSVSVFVYAFRGLATVTAVMFLLIGSSTYAYEKNVGPTNALYPLKKVQEDIRLAFTPQGQKSSFHLGLAEKRLEEAKILQTKNADSAQADRLVEEFKIEVKKSFETLSPPFEEANVAAYQSPKGDSQEPVAAPIPFPQEQEELSQETQSQAGITAPIPSSKSLRILSPNGGETFAPETPIKISWELPELSQKDRPYVHLYLRPYIDLGDGSNPLTKIEAHLNCF
ncbi:MAG: DUF5667 domain-containing protein, partial [Patescibacteria group bacterium]